jgi:tRNA G37 N-methylase Trm5/tRNA(Phe) wybutosine-synthesizing methylase Tyw3
MARGFDQSKAELLASLADGVDYSPKGSIDFPVRDIVHLINLHKDYVTTSSCSGRISVYECAGDTNSYNNTTKGIKWLLVKHEIVSKLDLLSAIAKAEGNRNAGNNDSQLVMLKVEPFILHVHVRDVDSARELHHLAYSCGYRESGISIGQKKVMVAVRTTGFGLELPIAENNHRLLLDEYTLDIIVQEANSRLLKNFARIDKFLGMLKSAWKWPQLSVVRSMNENDFRRFGHSTWTQHVFVRDNISHKDEKRSQLVVFGGSGCGDMDKVNDHALTNTTRKVPVSVVELSKPGTAISRVIDVEGAQRVHGAVCAWPVSSTVTLSIVSGGRLGPQAPLPCCDALLHHDLRTKVNAIVIPNSNGMVPEPRWGHTLTRLSEDNANCGVFFLFGGRTTDSLLRDGYLLITRVLAHHMEISDSPPTEVNVSIQWIPVDVDVSARCFHASCGVSTFFSGAYYYRAHQDYDANNEVLSAVHDAILHDAVVIHGGLTEIQDNPSTAGDFTIVYPFLGKSARIASTASHAAVGTEDSDASPSAQEKETKKSPDTLLFLRRFGHTITNIGAKSLLLAGGNSFEQDCPVGTSNVLQTAVVDISLSDSGEVLGSCRPALFPDTLPCEACRIHHTAEFDSSNQLLRLLGGGAACLSFGTHYCESVAIRCELAGRSSTDIDTEELLVISSSRSKQEYGSTSAAVLPPASDSTIVLLVPPAQVKQIKTLLEGAACLDKTKRISSVNESISSVMAIDIARQTITAADIESVSSCMAVPLTKELSDKLNKIINDNNTSTSSAGSGCYPQGYVRLFSDIEQQLQSSVVMVGCQQVRENKVLTVSNTKHAQDYLKDFASKHHLPSDCIPSKFELVGDVLMIPAESLHSGGWVKYTQIAHSSADINSHVVSFWSTLAQYFGVTRVARKAEIDSGEMRESKVRLLLPAIPGGKDNEHTGPGSIGWTTVIENGIKFSFDITRVMFCSGNVTERMRMGKQLAQTKKSKDGSADKLVVSTAGQVIVDLYCGIGYYTVPFLVHGQAKHVHACEWNPNSVLAIRHNLQANKVSPDRYTIYEGDNNVSANSPQLTNIADRVCLGLLPSSVKGWPLAVNVLNPSTGGILHVHENILQAEMEAWTEDAIKTFERLFVEAQKPMTVTCVHTEIVKNYAPRVVHVVVDLLCKPV